MARIKYAEIVGTRMAEEGGGGYTVNSTSYSVLVFCQDGSVELVEGSAKDIKHLLPYMRPHNDIAQLELLLNQFEDKLQKDIDQVIDMKINKIINTAYPLPDVRNKPYEEAKAILEKEGFLVELKNPKKASEAQGLVIQYSRKNGTMKTVVVRLGYVIPDVNGMSIDEATQKLQNAGFIVTAKKISKKEYVDGTVIGAEYAEDNDNDLILLINDLSGNNLNTVEDTFLFELRNKSSMAEILDLWDSYDLGLKYKNIDIYIKMRKESEEKDGVLKNLEQIKEVIAQMIKKDT